MKKLLSLIVTAFAFAGAVNAQPVLNGPKSSDLLGKTFAVKSQRLNPIALTFNDTSGANLTWNFSTFAKLGSVSESQIKYISPSETGSAAKFPNANLSIMPLPDQGTRVFIRLTDANLETHGTSGQAGEQSFAIIYDNPRTDLVFPFRYGAVNKDDFSYYNDLVPNLKSTGNVEMSYPAYGTFISPDYTVKDAILIKRVETNVVSGTTQRLIIYSWHRASDYQAFASLSISSAPGLPPQISLSYNLLDINSSDDRISLQPLSAAEMVPNPSGQGSEFRFVSQAAASGELRVMNALGQTVVSQPVSVTPGVNNFPLTVPAAGIYMVELNGIRTKWMAE